MRLLKDGGIYLASGLGSRLLPFLVLPLTTSLLAPEEFGRLSVFLGFNALVLAFVGMSVQTNVTLDFFNKPRSGLAATIGSLLLLLLTMGLLATALAAGVAWFSSGDVFSLPGWAFLLMPALAVLTASGSIYSAVLRAERNAGAYAGFELGRSGLSTGLGLSLLVGTELGWVAMVLGFVAAEFLVALLAISRLRARALLDISGRWHWERFAPLLAICLPLVPHTLGNAVIAVSDRAFIEAMVGVEAVALYAIGYSFGQVMALVTDSVAKAWTPWVYASLARGEPAQLRKVVGSCYLIAGFFVLAALAVGAASGLLLEILVAPAYRSAGAFVAWVTLAYAIRGIYQVFFPFLVHSRSTWFLAVSTGIAAALNLVLNYLLIGTYGAIGGAYATAVSFAVSAILVFLYQKRRLQMPWLKPDLRFG